MNLHQYDLTAFLFVAVAASMAGPAMYMALEYDPSSALESINLRLWPMKAFVTHSASASASAVFYFASACNSVLFIAISVFSWAVAKATSSKIVAILVFLMPVTMFEGWISGFDVEFVDWAALLVAGLFYATIPLVALFVSTLMIHSCNSRPKSGDTGQ